MPASRVNEIKTELEKLISTIVVSNNAVINATNANTIELRRVNEYLKEIKESKQKKAILPTIKDPGGPDIDDEIKSTFRSNTVLGDGASPVRIIKDDKEEEDGETDEKDGGMDKKDS